MKRIATLDKVTAHRCKRLGDLGEELAENLLKVNGFNNIQNLNLLKNNFPFADFYAEKDCVRYVISMKIRNKYESTCGEAKRLNSRYKLGSKCYEQAEVAEVQFDAKAAWLTISLDSETYSAYFGLLSLLNGSKGVAMSEKAVASYECLAKDAPHVFNYVELKNVYESAELT